MKAAREIEVEVVGKEEPRPRAALQNDDPFIALIARLMDTVFTIPGTNIRFGLDPLLGLLPGFGDTATAFISLLLIAQSSRYGVPKIVLARMAMNVLLNTAVGSIPIAGDAFSLFFRSNVRNYELLQKHAGTRRRATWGDWTFVAGLLTVVVALIVCIVIGAVTALGMLFSAPR